MKKVLYVATTARTHINSFHLPYIQWFQQNGWIVDVATNGDATVPFVNREFQISISRNPIKFCNIKAGWQLYKILKEGNYDLVSCHTPVGGVLARIAGHFVKVKNVMYTAHGFHFFNGGVPLKNKIYKSIERFLARWTDIIITINQEDFKSAGEFRLKEHGKIYRMNGMGVDVASFAKSSASRKSFGLNEKNIVFTNVGEMIARKNQVTLLKAFAEAKIPNSKLLICGDGKLDVMLKKMTLDLQIEKDVIFLGFYKDIQSILSITDVFVFPTYQEGLPIAVIEAMSAGLPVICSNVRGCYDLINDNGGILLSPSDIDGFTHAMKKLAENTELCKQYGARNIDAVKKYDIQNTVNQFANIIENIK